VPSGHRSPSDELRDGSLCDGNPHWPHYSFDNHFDADDYIAAGCGRPDYGYGYNYDDPPSRVVGPSGWGTSFNQHHHNSSCRSQHAI
jgi:hypothetical protein